MPPPHTDSSTRQQVVIDGRYCGPPGSANGGYVAGLMAEAVLSAHLRQCGPLRQAPQPAVQVTLRAPPPLDTPLALQVPGAALVTLRKGDTLLAEAQRATLDVSVPRAPSLAAARAMAAHHEGFDEQVYGRCFVCGVERAEGDGLRIFSGADPNAHSTAAEHSATPGLVAAPFVPDESVCDDGYARLTTMWAALDCSGYYAARQGKEIAVLGRMTAELLAPAIVGEPHIAIGFPLGRDGRKLHAGTALFDADGTLLGRSRQVWIRLPSAG